MFSRILCATDLGPQWPCMLGYALQLAEQASRKERVVLTILHVLEGDHPDTRVRAILRSAKANPARAVELAASIQAEIECDLPDQCAPGELGSIENVAVRWGEPTGTILGFAQDVSADMLVLGQRGRRAQLSTGLGSVAASVLSKSRVPVFIMPSLAAPASYAIISHFDNRSMG